MAYDPLYDPNFVPIFIKAKKKKKKKNDFKHKFCKFNKSGSKDILFFSSIGSFWEQANLYYAEYWHKNQLHPSNITKYYWISLKENGVLGCLWCKWIYLHSIISAVRNNRSALPGTLTFNKFLKEGKTFGTSSFKSFSWKVPVYSSVVASLFLGLNVDFVLKELM